MASFGHPEVTVEAPLQVRGVVLEPLGGFFVPPDLARQARRPQTRVVRIALDLARRDRRLGQATVPEADRVVRVLPALVVERDLGIGALPILEVPVTVEVGRPL